MKLELKGTTKRFGSLVAIDGEPVSFRGPGRRKIGESPVQGIVPIFGTPVPGQFTAMLPCLVTVLAVAGLVRRSGPLAASGMAYLKG